MKTISVNLYEYDELGKEAAKKAYLDWYKDAEYPSFDENKTVVEKFCKVFGGLNIDYEYDSTNYYAHVVGALTVNDDEAEISEIEEYTGKRLLQYLENNYNDMLNPKDNESLTGWYLDGVILEPLVKFSKEPHEITLRQLLNKCLTEWVKACSADLYEYFTEENFKQQSNDRDWHYLVDGSYFDEVTEKSC